MSISTMIYGIVFKNGENQCRVAEASVEWPYGHNLDFGQHKWDHMSLLCMIHQILKDILISFMSSYQPKAAVKSKSRHTIL
jgi:hypothetical protein